jgi:hypothetical protein
MDDIKTINLKKGLTKFQARCLEMYINDVFLPLFNKKGHKMVNLCSTEIAFISCAILDAKKEAEEKGKEPLLNVASTFEKNFDIELKHWNRLAEVFSETGEEDEEKETNFTNER